ncbi:phage head-tail joining protein [Acuticoccus mangrovi]|uniref:GpW protein n=1 Tax=Acuticoccus mangrovi TaxID=2796142 RepID=A0A934MJ93_9HYPH|nr:hypothetical protein [Acuticoccus mangrovi]MBJ3774344.1 hypothetical protein [Acuticoccus mangrovi]
MSETIELLEEQLERLREVRAKGVDSYTINTAMGSRSMTFRSDAQLAVAIRDVERRISALSRPRRPFLQLRVDRGLS